MTDDEHGSSHRADGLDEVLDVFVYAPIGAFLHGPETVGDLAAKGRQDVANARFIGRAVLDRSLGGGRDQIGGIVEATARRGVDLLVAAARAAGVPVDASTDPVVADEPDEATRLRVVDTPPDDRSDGPDVDMLAIPGYDTLAASQVVPRLDDLADDELAAVQDYERAHRGRMTILSRIAQLRAS